MAKLTLDIEFLMKKKQFKILQAILNDNIPFKTHFFLISNTL